MHECLCESFAPPRKAIPLQQNHKMYNLQLPISFINKVWLSKNQNILNISSNDGVVILKKPLQITCLIPILKKVKLQSNQAVLLPK